MASSRRRLNYFFIYHFLFYPIAWPPDSDELYNRYPLIWVRHFFLSHLKAEFLVISSLHHLSFPTLIRTRKLLALRPSRICIDMLSFYQFFVLFYALTFSMLHYPLQVAPSLSAFGYCFFFLHFSLTYERLCFSVVSHFSVARALIRWAKIPIKMAKWFPPQNSQKMPTLWMLSFVSDCLSSF